MKILLDENISYKLKLKLRPLFPNLVHVSDVNLLSSEDLNVFDFARKNNFDAIITNDEDYFWLSLTRGFPPKIIWLRTGNMTTNNLILLLSAKKNEIDNFLSDPIEICLEIK